MRKLLNKLFTSYDIQKEHKQLFGGGVVTKTTYTLFGRVVHTSTKPL